MIERELFDKMRNRRNVYYEESVLEKNRLRRKNV